MEVIDRNTYLNGIDSFLDYYLKRGHGVLELDNKYFYDLKGYIHASFCDMKPEFLDLVKDILPYENFKHIGYFPTPKPSTFIKLYIIAKAYIENFHDFENYQAIVEDVGNFDDYVYVYDLNSKFKMNKHIIDAMISYKHYKDIPNFRKLFGKLYDYFSWTSGSYNFDLDYRKVDKVIQEGKDLGIDEDRYLDIANKVIEVNEPLFVHSRPYLYSKLLLSGKRFEYLNDKLYEIERNWFIRKNIFSYISELNLGMFDEFRDEEEDYFITCMNVVFDSDSYQELSNKLNIIREASYLYGKKEKKASLEKIRTLTDLANKKTYCGEVVSYPVDCVNMLEKPKTILEREINLYRQINDSISYEFMVGVHYHAETLGGMIGVVDKILNRELSPVNVFKRKIKSKFEKKKIGDK